MDILYLEDSDLDVKFVQQYMDSVNHSFTAIHTIEEAWEYLEANSVKVFLVDIIIGQDTAYDLIQQVAARKAVEHIIAATAKALPSEKKYCMELGCSAVLVKPFTIDELERVLTQFL
jgi:CheY-like chemotaxis protein